MTDQEIWNNYYMQGATVQREDDDESDLSVAESVMLWAGASLVVLLLVAFAALTAKIWL